MPLTTDGSPNDVLSLSLPAGSYAVTARVEIINNADPSSTTITSLYTVCYLHSGQGRLDTTESVVSLGTVDVFTTLPLQGVVTLSDPGPVTLSCYEGVPYTINPSAQRAVLTALPVNQIISQ